jgi:hypothetical protein
VTARERRKRAGERLVLAWSVAVIPNFLVAVGVEFDGAWMIVRYLLSAIFIVALVVWLAALWRERRTRTR